MASQTALIIGATGSVGKHLLKELLNSPNFSRVGEFGRRITPLGGSGLRNTEKLVQKVVDFNAPSEAGFTEERWDVVFITMGTKRKKAGSLENFIKIDQDFVVNAARSARVSGARQRLVYVSSAGANRSSYISYLRSKGQTEVRLASLGYDDVVVFRPGTLLNTQREEFILLERMSQFCVSPLTVLTDSIGITVDALAKAVRIAGELGSSNLPPVAEAVVSGGTDVSPFITIFSKGAVRLSRIQ